MKKEIRIGRLTKFFKWINPYKGLTPEWCARAFEYLRYFEVMEQLANGCSIEELIDEGCLEEEELYDLQRDMFARYEINPICAPRMTQEVLDAWYGEAGDPHPEDEE